MRSRSSDECIQAFIRAILLAEKIADVSLDGGGEGGKEIAELAIAEWNLARERSPSCAVVDLVNQNPIGAGVPTRRLAPSSAVSSYAREGTRYGSKTPMSAAHRGSLSLRKASNLLMFSAGSDNYTAEKSAGGSARRMDFL